jgi:hypothetical protein
LPVKEQVQLPRQHLLLLLLPHGALPVEITQSHVPLLLLLLRLRLQQPLQQQQQA